VSGAIEVIRQGWDFLIHALGYTPVLMIPVFFIVSMTSFALKVRQRFPTWKNFILGILCLVAAASVVALSGDHETVGELANRSLIVGSVSALTYQIFKGFFTGTKEWLIKKMKSSTGITVDIEDNDIVE